jgi:hypothetical protein
MENIGTFQNVLGNAWEAITLQDHFYDQFYSLSRQYLAYGLIELQNLAVHRYECLQELLDLM